jgi:hypothetical protein
MRHYVQIAAGCLMVVLMAAPVLAQSSSPPTTPPGSGPSPSSTPGMSPSGTPGKSPTAPPEKSQGVQKSSDSQNATGASDTGMTHKGMHTAGKANVRQAQEALKAQGQDPGPIDGVMGPKTQEALRAYQRSQNLTETGRLDSETAQKLGISGTGNQK